MPVLLENQNMMNSSYEWESKIGRNKALHGANRASVPTSHTDWAWAFCGYERWRHDVAEARLEVSSWKIALQMSDRSDGKDKGLRHKGALRIAKDKPTIRRCMMRGRTVTDKILNGRNFDKLRGTSWFSKENKHDFRFASIFFLSNYLMHCILNKTEIIKY